MSKGLHKLTAEFVLFLANAQLTGEEPKLDRGPERGKTCVSYDDAI
jgi:hypothetical protein